MPAPEDLLGDALLLTQKMLELAEKDEWEGVMELEKKQSALLRDCFQQEPPLDRSASAEVIQEILALHEKIFEVASHFRSHIKKELSTMKKGRNANRAYLSHSS